MTRTATTGRANSKVYWSRSVPIELNGCPLSGTALRIANGIQGRDAAALDGAECPVPGSRSKPLYDRHGSLCAGRLKIIEWRLSRIRCRKRPFRSRPEQDDRYPGASPASGRSQTPMPAVRPNAVPCPLTRRRRAPCPSVESHREGYRPLVKPPFPPPASCGGKEALCRRQRHLLAWAEPLKVENAPHRQSGRISGEASAAACSKRRG